MTAPEIAILFALSLGVAATAVLAVVLWPIVCAVLLVALAAGVTGDLVMGRTMRW